MRVFLLPPRYYPADPPEALEKLIGHVKTDLLPDLTDRGIKFSKDNQSAFIEFGFADSGLIQRIVIACANGKTFPVHGGSMGASFVGSEDNQYLVIVEGPADLWPPPPTRTKEIWQADGKGCWKQLPDGAPAPP